MEGKKMMGKKSEEGGDHQVMDGSDLIELVENEKVFSNFVDHKFQELDRDCDGKLSVKELQPAVADIGAALGLPAQGTSPDSDHIYSEVLKEFTHGNEEKVGKPVFKEVLSDILLGMAAGLKRDPIVILRIDGEDLLEFVKNPSYEPEMVSIFSEITSPEGYSLKQLVIMALEKLKVEHGMPPASDSWVISNVLEPVLQTCGVLDDEQTVSEENFLVEFKNVAERVAQHLREQPVIVAHSESTFDGSDIKRQLSNKFELDKTLDAAMKSVPKDSNGKISKEYLRVVLDFVAPSAGLPPFGAVDQMDKIIAEALKMMDADDGKIVKEEEFKKIMAEVLGSIMLQLEGNPVSVSTNSADSLLLKRTGYLAVTLFLNEDHDLIILIVNTIQKDLKSDNFLVVCAALNAVCRLINEETIPAVLPQVVELLGHAKEAVRKKAVMALHRFYQRSPSSVSHLVSNFRKRLCDNDPGVMGATLCPLFDLITIDVNSYKDLVVSFVSILKQVAERRLPKTYDYHQMPAPFIQIKLLKILAVLGNGDKQASEQMYTVVGDIMRKSDTTSNIGNAILYECICCVSSIHPNPKLLEAAADAISKFLKSDSHNLKYMGIDALGRLIKISPEIAEQHQLSVIDCLEDPDDTLKRKTFELLYKMTKSSNVEVVVDRMIDYMISINDNHYKTDIASRCVELAEQFAPSNHWFIQIMNKVFEHAGDLVNVKVAHNLMRLIAEGFGEDDDTADSQLRSSAVESYLRIIGEPKLPSAFLQVICWVLGEYGTADGKYSASYISGKLCDVAEAHSSDDTVKAYAVTALMKIYSFEIAAGKKVDMLPECQSLIEELSASSSTDLQQRAYELQVVIGLDAHAVENIMPLDASCEDIEIDKDLSFLNSYVQQSLEKGAQPYIPESARSGILDFSNFRSQDQHEASAHALRFEAYELPKPTMPTRIPATIVPSTELVPVPEPSYVREIHQAPLVSSVSHAGSSELKLRLDGVQKKWGRPTYSSPAPSTSNTDSHKTLNRAAQPDAKGSGNPRARDASHDLRRQQIEISPERQKLAASLFGGTSKSEKRQSAAADRGSKVNSHSADDTHLTKGLAVSEPTAVKATPLQPPPDLLDLGEHTVTSSAVSVDPFQQLEGLVDVTQDTSATNSGSVATKAPDFMSLYGELSSGRSRSIDVNIGSGFLGASNSNAHGGSTVTHPPQSTNKGPNLKDALEKDALVRQMGVTLTHQNPNLFRDLLG